MRELTKKQKSLLDKWFKENCPSNDNRVMFGEHPKLTNVNELSSEQWTILKEINDTEILWQNINRHLGDLYSKWVVQI